MASVLRFHPRVAQDLAEATRWYDEISIELGNRFRGSTNAILDTIELRPESFGRAQESLRAARVDGFPYLIVFEHTDNITQVLGIFHAAADPDKWGARKP